MATHRRLLDRACSQVEQAIQLWEKAMQSASSPLGHSARTLSLTASTLQEPAIFRGPTSEPDGCRKRISMSSHIGCSCMDCASTADYGVVCWQVPASYNRGKLLGNRHLSRIIEASGPVE
jgi:hypothetical protein